MKIVGLCGGSGSGKGAVGQLFEKHGVPVIDTDAVYHELTSARSECIDELVLAFGNSIIDENGALNRPALGKIVFSSGASDKLQLLNKITHKHILLKTREMLGNFSERGFSMVVVDAPLLFESEFNKECDIIVSVIADKNTRVERIMSRDKISEDVARRRIATQLGDDFLIANSDFVIRNDSTLSELAEKFEILINDIKI